ncbi:MAG: Asp-tRNA(Asn)/Glu-tRNA(Gln) amidotransferase subunit GatB [Anaerorhabdus sp.]
MEYDVVIGIEIHCELKTKTKMFSGAPCQFGAEVNTCVNEIDLGHPGTLPSVNKEAVRKALQACMAFHLEIDPLVRFDRKNYYYSDLPKGFQITQQFHPLGQAGYVVVEVDGEKKKIRINRIHMEEDTAKQFHMEKETLIDFNRSGTPLIEIVSEPDMTSGKEAAAYVESLRQTLYYLGVSDVKMEEGSMRCDVNISLKPKGATEFGVKNEIKNLNSINNVQRAIEFEIDRQKTVLDAGGKIEQATRRFDEASKTTVVMRLKEGAVDYKFFPEPNIPPIRLDEAWIKEIEENLPELPEEKKERYEKDYQLQGSECDLLINNKELGEFYEKVMEHTTSAKLAWNWVAVDVLAWCNKTSQEISAVENIAPELASLISSIEKQEISGKQAKELFPEMMGGKVVQDLIESKGLKQVSDTGLLQGLVEEVLNENPQSIEDYKNGKDRAVGFLVGQIMKKSNGQANPGLTNKMVVEELGKRIKQ